MHPGKDVCNFSRSLGVLREVAAGSSITRKYPRNPASHLRDPSSVFLGFGGVLQMVH